MQQIVKESVLFIPQLVLILSDPVHASRDPQEVFHKLQSHGLVGGVVHGQLKRNLEHVLAIQRHPCRAIRLLQISAGGQGLTAVENTDVIEAEESAFEEIPARRVLAICPPTEI